MHAPWLIARVSRDGVWHVVTNHKVARMEPVGGWDSLCGRYTAREDRTNPIDPARPRPVFGVDRARVCGFCLAAADRALEHHTKLVAELHEVAGR